MEMPRIESELPPSSDPLGEVLQLLQLTGVLYCSAELSDPWGIEVPELPGVMNVEVVTSGQCWLELDGEAPVFLPEGSLVLIPRGKRHKLRGNPGDRTTPLEDIPVERIGERFEIMRFGGGGRPTGRLGRGDLRRRLDPGRAHPRGLRPRGALRRRGDAGADSVPRGRG